MTDTDQLEADLRTTYKRLFPLRNAENKIFSDEIVTLGTLLRKQIHAHAPVYSFTPCPPRYADGATPGPTVRSKRKGKRPD